MRPIGFSTGALAYSEFLLGLSLVARHGLRAVELSALREREVRPLINAIPDLPLNEYSYISFHAPSQLVDWSEPDLVQFLTDHLPTAWPIIVHPDVIRHPESWRALGDRLCLENMDRRKPCGRTAGELRPFFEDLPDATFCLDLAHAHQVDPTMSVATELLLVYKDRLTQVHCSELDSNSNHGPMSMRTFLAYQRVANLIPSNCPIIIEAVVDGANIDREVDVTRASLADRESSTSWLRQHDTHSQPIPA